MSQTATDLAVFEHSLADFNAGATLPAHMAGIANALLARAREADGNSPVLAAMTDFEDNGQVVLSATAGSMKAVIAQARQEITRDDF